MEDVIRLERQNRILVLVGLVLFLLCFLAIGFIAWRLKETSHISASQKSGIVSAQQFDLIDEKGRLHGTFATTSDGAVFALYGQVNGKAEGQVIALEAVGDSFSWMNIGSKEHNRGRIEIRSAGEIQNISISDSEGFKAVVGSTSLINSHTGQTTDTSAATVTLFAKDGHIISMVPKP